MDKLVIRSRKVTFMETGIDEFTRMKGFTNMATNKNPEEYSRKYVDEDFETTDVVGMSTSIEYEFDLFEDNPVHKTLVDISDKEKLGDDAVVDIVVVDFTEEDLVGGYKAVKRAFAVVPESDGDGTEAYTYGGNFKVKGERIEGVATSDDDWQTCIFVADGGVVEE